MAQPIPTIAKRHVAATVVGNALEFYDFTTYALFATQIGNAFFPAHNAFVSLMLSLITFAIGFVSRPIGAIVLGLVADRVGRKQALLLSFALMGAGLIGLALVPPYAKIGIAAPALVVACRLVQGFALGGEVGPTMAYLIEAAPVFRRGLYGAWQSASQSIATLTGSFVGVLLSTWLTHDQLNAWGWRVAFLIGALVLPFGLYIRSSLPETLHHEEPTLNVQPASSKIRGNIRPILLGVMIIISFTVSTYVMSYMTTYSLQSLHMPGNVAFGAGVVNGVVGVVFTLIGGGLSDRLGRKPMMIIPRLLFLLAVFPAFYLIAHNRNAVTLWVATGVIGALSSLSTGAALINLTETVRKEVRGLGVGVVYAVAVTIFGGTTQAVIAGLIHMTGNLFAGAFYMMATTALGIAGMLMMRESAPRKVMPA